MKIRPELQPDDLGWIIVIGAITIVEFRLPRDRMLSHAVARYRRSHPVLTYAAVLITAAHLLEKLPPPLDPYHVLLQRLRGPIPPPKDPHPRHD